MKESLAKGHVDKNEVWHENLTMHIFQCRTKPTHNQSPGTYAGRYHPFNDAYL